MPFDTAARAALPAFGTMPPGPVQTFRSSLIAGMSRILLGRRSLPVQCAILAVLVGLAFALRKIVDPALPPGFPFLTFFPAVLLTAIFASIKMGILAAILSGLLAWYFFIPPFTAFSLEPSALVAMGFYVVVTATELFFIWLTALALRHVQAERERSLALAQSRDLMFSELQHRVSNNLATMGALLRLQSARLAEGDAKQALVAAMQRLNTVSRIQRSLYSPDAQAIEVDAFLAQLSCDIRESFAMGAEAVIDIKAEKLRLVSDQAIPFGLIASEMIMNALEHARPTAGPLCIRLECARTRPEGSEGPWLRLGIADNGAGLPPEAELSKSLGISISRQFARSLGGSLTLRNRPDAGGALAELHFPLAA
ncbi:MAG: DUF4118 domain-containing protein [Gemmobacter sp.]|nr:DUF4118 domain-containing protein [Gemmobacter sp.]